MFMSSINYLIYGAVKQFTFDFKVVESKSKTINICYGRN